MSDPNLQQHILNNANSRSGDTCCCYCGVQMLIREKRDPPHPQRLTRDHVVPRSKGGRLIVECCSKCNLDKGILSLEEFRLVLAYRNGKIPGCADKFRFHKEDILKRAQEQK